MEYILIPKWVTHEEIKHSTFLPHFLKRVKIEEDKVDLNYLRNNYREDKVACQKLIDEMALRGFSFVCKKSNNILPKGSINEDAIFIRSDMNGEKYKGIDFEGIGVADFVSRFSIKNDMFFNNIPIEGFLYLNKNININKLINEFEINGFVFSNKLENNIEISINEKDIEDKHINELELSNRAHNCLKRQGILFVSDLLKLDREKLLQFKNVGVKTFDEICLKISEINQVGIKSAMKINNNDGFEKLGFSVRARNALKKNSINSMEQLIMLSVNAIREFRNIGDKTVNEIQNKIEKWKESNDYQLYLYSKGANLSDDILILYGEIKVVYFEEGFLDNEVLVKDLQECSFDELVELYGKEHSVLIINKLKSLKTFKDMVEAVKISEKEREILENRFINGETLIEIGQVIKVTRERVRQIQKKAEKKIMNRLRANGFFKCLRAINCCKKTCSTELVRSSLNNNELFYYVIEKSNLSPLIYEENLDCFFLEGLESFENRFISLLDKQEDLFNIIDILDDVLELTDEYSIDNLDVSNVEKLLDRFGFYVYGEIACKKRLSSIDVISIIYKNYIEGALRFDKDGLEYCKKLAKEYLNFSDLATNTRGLDSRMRETDDLILVDKATYMHISKLEYNHNVIDILDQYLEDKMSQTTVVSISELMKDNRLLLENTVLDNKRIIYSLLKKQLGDKYDFGKKNTLNIYYNGTEKKKNMKETLIEYLLGNGGRAHKDNIINDLNWSLISLDNTIINYRDFFTSVGNKIIKLGKELLITDEEKAKLDALIELNLKDEYFGVKVVFLDMKCDPCLNQFLRNNEIENSLVLSQILKRLYQEYVGHSVILYKRSSSYRRIEDVILDKYSNTTRDRIKNFLVKLGYSELAAYSIVFKLIGSGKYVEISDDKILRTEILNIDEYIEKEVYNFFEKYYEENGYISLKSISGYRKSLPKIDYRWNAYLMRTVLLRTNYRDIKLKVRDNRTDKLLMVKDSSDIQTFEELCYRLIKKNYSGNMHESRVYNFLANAGVLIKKESLSTKRLPNELRTGNLMSVDEVGKVVMRD